MANLPNAFQDTGENVLASFDFTDIASGTGVIRYSGMDSMASGGAASFALVTSSSIPSLTIETSVDGTTQNYDSTAFNLPRTVRGTAVVRFAAINTAGNNATFTAAVQNVRGGTATTIGTMNTSALTTAMGAKNFTVHIPLTTTLFKKGDILRLAITTASAGATVYMAHDPQDRSATQVNVSISVALMPTTMDLYLPFKIDL